MTFKEHVFIRSEEFSSSYFQKFVLGGDIGSTNIRLAVFGLDHQGNLQPIFKVVTKTKQVEELHVPINYIVTQAKDRYKIDIADAAIGFAGPTYDNRQTCILTGLDRPVDIQSLTEKTSLNRIILLNDFEAIGYGIDVIPEEDMIEIPHANNTTPPAKILETRAVLGPGTGLGQAMITYDTGKRSYIPLPSEGGGEDFAPKTDLQKKLLEFIIKHKLFRNSSFPDWNDMLSGRGVLNIFKFLTTTKKIPAKRSLIHQLENSDDKAKAISKFAIEGDLTCQKTMDLFFELFGQRAALLAFTAKSTGGLYIAGEIAAEDIILIKKGRFMKAFDSIKQTSHPLHKLTMDIPVFIIKNRDTGMYGAANVAANHADEF